MFRSRSPLRSLRAVLRATAVVVLLQAGIALADEGAAAQPSPPPPPPEVESSVTTTVPPPAPSSTLDGQLKVFELTDGQTLRGKLIAETPTAYEIELAGGSRLVLSKQSVARVIGERGAAVKNGVVWFEDANRTRYFYGPSAMMLKQGQAYFSQKELLFSSLAYGITDHLNVQVGAVLPAYFIGLANNQPLVGVNGIFAIKGGGQVNDWLHIAGGIQAGAIRYDTGGDSTIGGGFFFGTATAGTPDEHLSLSVGKPFLVSSSGLGGGDSFIFTISGNKRVSEHVALMTENWLLIPGSDRAFDSSFATVDAVGARVMGERIAADLGFLWAFSDKGLATAIPVPWVDFTYNFDLLAQAK